MYLQHGQFTLEEIISYNNLEGYNLEISFEDNFINSISLKKLNANSYYLGLVQNLYAGSEGELASFLQTSYQFPLIKDSNEELYNLLKKISEQDKKHLEILSYLILSLGGSPKYFNAQNKWFSTREIDYVQGTKQILSYDIELKEKIVLDYKSTIQKISAQELKDILQRVLADEENHLSKLKHIYAKL